ncbi:type 1 fimbrial protein [Paraburkholderia sp. Ac-20342]|uniref:fimbrial protein n=1 Tax=Paraburkholderia sp. Ac-20342 TaxID=2703889 RepID=UPI00197D68D1|nr:fimbrial protein [Paraburkholderia sp. Ac-20342]MBN3846950.1 type 1 fimbrial protein [Paraburkholderia sp. Ac-20342]
MFNTMITALIQKFFGGKPVVRAASLVFAGCLAWSSQATAASTCSSQAAWGGMTAWTIKPLTEKVTAGMVLATANAASHTFILNPTEGELFRSVSSWFGTKPESEFQTIPLRGAAGVGLRVTWEAATSSGGIKDMTTVDPGTVIAGQPITTMSGKLDGSASDVLYADTFKFELVVTDPALYVGGDKTLSTESFFFYWTGFGEATFPDDPNGTGCIVSMATLPPGALANIKLPYEPVPTCEFDTAALNQTVPLLPIVSASVARSNASRSAGAEGEMGFTLSARNCDAGAKFSLYFTDALSEGSERDYLQQANDSNVGIRIYYGNSTTPVEFGPAPVGSTLPSRAPISLGDKSVPVGATYDLPFTAQYVRLPDMEGGASVGEVSAKAKVTVVYL